MLNCAIGWRAGLAGALIMAASVAQAAGTPASVFDAYTQAVNSGQIAALRPLVAASIAQPPFARCPPAQSGYDCMISYVDETVIKRHGQLTTNKVDVKGNTVYASVELRNDMTKAAGVDRIVGVDRVKVVGGQIAGFAFLRDEHDTQTSQFFKFMMSHGGPRPKQQ